MRYSLIIAAALLTACGAPIRPTVSVGAASAADLKNKEPSNQAQPSSSTQTNYSQSGAAGGTSDEVILEAALPSAVVSGAFLSCRPTIDKNLAACEIPHNGLGRSSDAIKWSVTSDAKDKAVSVNVLQAIELKDSSLVFLEVADLKKGTITAVTGEATKAPVVFRYDSNSSETPYTVPVNTANMDFLSIAGKNYFYGPDDGRMGACLKPGMKPIKSHDYRFSFNNPMSEAQVYVTGVCGLEGKMAKVTLSGIPPFKTIEAILVPGAPDQLLAKDLTMPQDTYSLKIDNSENRLPDGSIDSFSFGFISLIRAKGAHLQTWDFSAIEYWD